MDILLERIIECIGPRHGAKKELAEHLGIHPQCHHKLAEWT